MGTGNAQLDLVRRLGRRLEAAGGYQLRPKSSRRSEAIQAFGLAGPSRSSIMMDGKNLAGTPGRTSTKIDPMDGNR